MSFTRGSCAHLSVLVGTTLAVALTVLPGGVATAASPPSATSAEPDIMLELQADGLVSKATVPLADAAPAAARSSSQGTLSPRLSTSTFSQVALTWRGKDPGASVRVRRNGHWSTWKDLEPLGDGPERGSAEGRRAVDRRASDLVWVGSADGVQVRSSNARADDVDLVLIDPGETSSDRARTTSTTESNKAERTAAARVAAAEDEPVTARLATSTRHAPRPNLNARRTWNPDPRKLNGTPVYMKRLKQVHIHHTASGNGYSRSDVPRMIRGMYNYHTDSLGWFDIGYNFLVDRFARIWVGRSGGAHRLVRGAHTLGFNHKSVGIAMIGNFESADPRREARTAIVKLAAWKFGKNGKRLATGRVRITSKGSDRFPAGTTVKLPRIDGHRDTNQTACPGQKLYDKLPTIRRRTQKRMDKYAVPQ
ncbi:hypothetical protein ncot_05155 [Nocardioides sp. JQ2195]|uniref:peptidoglycan recognition protein family protein n=1 Tax=Nocardioides sp. JQ2195 TaxID=2592334 RepID=UPI00143EF12D|nr:N-acetylmuramoyl-L-alanine amidase [Nocardioides sp. JQ2195]QIX26057.1 hypothetical protein ncot_05155 [Nocardioides sp. JQ2195]